MEKEEKEELKENFCPPCLAAIPLAFAATGAGASQAVDGTTDSGEKTKNIIIIISWIFGGIGTVLLIWWVLKNLGIIKCASCQD